MYINASLYPEMEQPPFSLDTPEAKADYLHRVCSAWDFYLLPEPETFDMLQTWKDTFDKFPIPTSPAYHTFRAWFGWEAVRPPFKLVLPKPQYQILDELEGRGEDPCASLI
jgi:hypothetical protein